MSDDRVNVACPYCGEPYNLLASSISTWWKCRNDDCRHAFEVEDPSDASEGKPANGNEDCEVPLRELDTSSIDEAADDGIISLEAHIPTDDETPPATNLPTHSEPDQDESPAHSAEWPRDVAADSGYGSGSGLQELDTFLGEEDVPSESPVKSGDAYPGEEVSIGEAGSGPQTPIKPVLTKKQKLRRRMKRIAGCVFVLGAIAVVAIITLRPQPNEVADWDDAIRLYEEQKWAKAKRAFSRYGDNFPDSDRAREIPFFIDMCKAGDDIFSRTGNPDEGWKQIQKIYNEHQANPAYAMYAHRFREAIEELKTTFVDQAKGFNSQVRSITPHRIIQLDDSGLFSDLDQTKADIQTQRDKLQEASERLETATKTLNHLENVSLASVDDADQATPPEATPPEATPTTNGSLGQDIENQRRQTRYLEDRIRVLEQLTKVLDVENQIGADQLDDLYDAIKGKLDELSVSPSPPTEDSTSPGTPPVVWQQQTDELLRIAYRRESRRITYTPWPVEQFPNRASILPAGHSKRTDTVQSLFIVRGSDGTQSNQKSGSQVYFGIARGVLYAFDAKGTFLWARRLGLDSYALPVSVPATATAPQRVVAVSTIENTLLALNARTGEVDWEYGVDLDQNLLAPLTVIRIPSVVPNKSDHEVGLLPTATGQIHVIELNRGKNIGTYEVGHPLLHRGIYDAKTQYVYFAADAKRVFAINPAVIAQGLAAESKDPSSASPAVLYTDHAAGALRGAPLVLGSYLITSEVFDLEKIKLRAFEINEPEDGLDVFPEIEQDPLKEFTLDGLSWFEPAHIPDRLALITDEGHLGIYGINLDNVTEAMYPLVEDEDGHVHSVSALDSSRSMVVRSDEQFAWILANGEMQHLFLDVRNQKIETIWPTEGEESPVKGYPLHRAQSDEWSTTFYIVSADLNDSECEFTSVDAATGTVHWHRILGLIFFDDPRPLEDGSVALLDRSGALVKLTEQDFVPGVARNILSLPAAGAEVEIPKACKREDMKLIQGEEKILYLVGYAESENKLYAKRVGDQNRRSSPWKNASLLSKPLGKSVIRDGKLVAACEDGYVHFRDFRATQRTQPFQWDSDGVIDQKEGITASVFIGPGKGFGRLVLINGKQIRGLLINETLGLVRFQKNGNVELSSTAQGAPIISENGEVCVVSRDNKLNWIDLDRDSVVRSEQLPGSLAGDPAQCGTLVCVALDDRSIMGFAIDSRSDIQWQSDPLQGDVVGKPMMIDGDLVVTDLSGQITAFDARNGKAVWPEPIKLGLGQIPSAAAVLIGDDHLLVPLIDGSFVQIKIPEQPDSKSDRNPS